MKKLCRLLAFLLAALLCAPAHAQSLVQAVVHSSLALTGTGTSTGSKAFGSNVTAGNTIVVAFTFRDASAAGFTGYTISVTDTQTNTFTRLQGACEVFDTTSSRNVTAWIYTASAGSSAADTVSISVSGGANMRGGALWLMELSGNGAASYGSTCSPVYNSGGVTTNAAPGFGYTTSAFTFAVVQYDGGTACTLSGLPTGSWTTIQENTANAEFDLIYPTSGNTSPTNFTSNCSGSGSNASVVLGAGAVLSPALDTNQGAAWGTASSGTITISTNGTNRLLFLGIGTRKSGSANTVSTVADTASLSWAKRSSNSTTAASCSTDTIHEEFWWAFSSAKLTSDVITVTLAGAGTAVAVGVATVSPVVSPTTPFDTNGSVPDFEPPDGAASTVTLSTSGANDAIIIGALNCNNSNQSIGAGPQFYFLNNWYQNSADGNGTFRFPAAYGAFSTPQSNQTFQVTSAGTFPTFGDAITGSPSASATGRPRVFFIGH